MNDIVKISKSDISSLNFLHPEDHNPNNVSVSEENIICIVYPNYLVIGSIAFQPLSDDRHYMLRQDEVDLNVDSANKIIEIKDLVVNEDSSNVRHDDNTFLQMLCDHDCILGHQHETSSMQFSHSAWSPRDSVSKKSFLAVMKIDGRIILMTQNIITKVWQKEFDMMDLYHEYYKTNILKAPYTEEGGIVCKDPVEYLRIKEDLDLLDFSWSSIARPDLNNVSFLLAILTSSGIVTIWKISSSQFKSECLLVFQDSVKIRNCQALSIEFCDVNQHSFMLIVSYSNEKIVAYPCIIETANEYPEMSIRKSGNPILLNRQTFSNPITKIYWSTELLHLFIGYESLMFIAKFNQTDNEITSYETMLLELPSSGSVTGIAVSRGIVYVTTHDGCLFGIKLEHTLDNLELNQMMFEGSELTTNSHFLDVFVSTNGVHLGFIHIDTDKVVKTDKLRPLADIVILRLLPEPQLLNVLMDDQMAFVLKQDAVEEMRNLYFTKKHILNQATNKLIGTESNWDTSSFHDLQLIRYMCIFFGYQLNIGEELSTTDTNRRQMDLSKMRKLESIIVIRTISQWIKQFQEYSPADLQKDDCVYVLGLITRLQQLSDLPNVFESLQSVYSKARTLLFSMFKTSQADIDAYEIESQDRKCPICLVECEFSIFSLKCPSNHILPRCCKSLEVCSTGFKQCENCGAYERLSEPSTFSPWRLDIFTANCPLCDGKFVKVDV